MMAGESAEKVQLVEVANNLKEKVKITGTGKINMDAVERAEAALKELSSQFDGWLDEEIERLGRTHDAVREHGLVPPHSDELYRSAHDIKGQGDTFGYPLAATICGSLCKLLGSVEDQTQIPMELIDHHVNAVRRVKLDGIKTLDHPTGRAVAEQLGDLVLSYIETAAPAEDNGDAAAS